jgi:uncharacterized protein (TIGR02996 family)
MTDEDAFLNAILAAPDDDLVRLVFADWLEERAGPGDGNRAEFIRLSLAVPHTVFWQLHSEAISPDDSSAVDHAHALCQVHWTDWTQSLRDRVAGSPLHRWLGKPDCRWGYRRGFVANFEGTLQVVLDAWDDLFKLGPIEDLRVHNLWHLAP